MKTSINSRCWVKWAFRLSLGCLYRRYSVFFNSWNFVHRDKIRSWNKYYLSKILIRILPWDPWLPRCSRNLARSCQDSQDASKRVNPGFHEWNHVVKHNSFMWFPCMESYETIWYSYGTIWFLTWNRMEQYCAMDRMVRHRMIPFMKSLKISSLHT